MGPISTIKFILNHPLARLNRSAALWRYFRWQVGSRLAPAMLIDFVGDTKMLVSRGMTGATGNIYCGLHEFEDMAFTSHFLRKGDLFVDVGANIGSYSLLAATAGADVIAFEPGERFDDLRRNALINQFDIDCRKMAVGSESGTMAFTQGRDAMNRFAASGEASTSVAVTTLDASLDRDPALIKVDVEGFEGAVLQGGRRRIAQAQALLLELVGQGEAHGYQEAEIVATLLDMGFRKAGYDPWKRELTPERTGGNTLFVKPGLESRLASAPPIRVNRFRI
jgi:FkbM family methyltransferase